MKKNDLKTRSFIYSRTDTTSINTFKAIFMQYREPNWVCEKYVGMYVLISWSLILTGLPCPTRKSDKKSP